jgi:cephalosporin-C deacetylase-like acetyl esterase
VVDARRAVDVLSARKDVDPNRIAFVGLSAGAKVGAILAGVDHRIHTFDLLSGGSPTVASYAAAAPPTYRPEVTKVLETIDPLHFAHESSPSMVLYQDGRHDDVVPHPALVGLYRATGEPKQVRWYDSGHLPSNKVVHDMLRFLAHRLGLGGPVVKGAVAGP